MKFCHNFTKYSSNQITMISRKKLVSSTAHFLSRKKRQYRIRKKSHIYENVNGVLKAIILSKCQKKPSTKLTSLYYNAFSIFFTLKEKSSFFSCDIILTSIFPMIFDGKVAVSRQIPSKNVMMQKKASVFCGLQAKNCSVCKNC